MADRRNYSRRKCCRLRNRRCTRRLSALDHNPGAARVNLRNGEIQFSVRGLVFAGGAPGITIGTPGPITGVKGTLVCDVDGSASGGNSILVETPSVPLSSTGDAAFSGKVGPLPDVCSSERDLAFLVRASVFGGNSVEGPWIANGAGLSTGKDERDNDTQ